MSDETEEYIDSVSIPTLVWIGESGSGRREMISAFVKARLSTLTPNGTITEKPEWNTVLPDEGSSESLQKGLRKEHYAHICLFDAPEGEEAASFFSFFPVPALFCGRNAVKAKKKD